MADNALALVQQTQVPQTLDERKRETDLTIGTATYWAQKLMEVVEKCDMSKKMGTKKYLEVEGWLVIAEFARIRAIPEPTTEWRDAVTGDLLGYECRALLKNEAGEVIGSGDSSCGLDAFPCRGKIGSEKDKAARSAAQTWAISRALRNKFSYIAKLAGYQAVPAEEMYTHSEPPGDDSGYAPGQGRSSVKSAPKAAPRASQGATKALGEAILEFTNQDKKAASEILIMLTGKTTLKDVTEQQAAVAMERFLREYAARQPGDDDDQIPDYPVPE